MSRTIVIIATLDTRGDEAKCVKEEIEKKGCSTIVIDPGVMGSPYFKADIAREEVAEAGGKSLKQLQNEALDGAARGSATAIMSKGLNRIVRSLYAVGKLDGVISLGGATGAKLGTTAMRELPVGIPKLQVCTHPELKSFGIKDITVMQSPVDLVGLNNIIRRLLANAANAIAAMAEVGGEVESSAKLTVGISCWGVVTPGAMNMISLLEKRGYEAVLVHGLTAPLADMIDNDLISSVVDLCAQELIDLHIMPTLMSEIAREEIVEDRLGSVGLKALPWILTPGTLDGAFFPLDNPLFKDRRQTEHTPGHTLVRTSKEEMARLGEIVARIANKAKGPVAVAIPLHGFSANDRVGLALYDPEADIAFTRAVESNVREHVKVLKINSHINDKEFAEAVVDLLGEMYNEKKASVLD